MERIEVDQPWLAVHAHSELNPVWLEIASFQFIKALYSLGSRRFKKFFYPGAKRKKLSFSCPYNQFHNSIGFLMTAARICISQVFWNADFNKSDFTNLSLF